MDDLLPSSFPLLLSALLAVATLSCWAAKLSSFRRSSRGSVQKLNSTCPRKSSQLVWRPSGGIGRPRGLNSLRGPTEEEDGDALLSALGRRRRRLSPLSLLLFSSESLDPPLLLCSAHITFFRRRAASACSPSRCQLSARGRRKTHVRESATESSWLGQIMGISKATTLWFSFHLRARFSPEHLANAFLFSSSEQIAHFSSCGQEGRKRHNSCRPIEALRDGRTREEVS